MFVGVQYHAKDRRQQQFLIFTITYIANAGGFAR